MEFQIKIIKPDDCSSELLEVFYDIVLSGKQIPEKFIAGGLKRSDFLAYCLSNDKIVGVASIKNPTDNYRTSVFTKAKVPHLADKYDLEIGYAVTLEQHRGNGISPKLINSLINHCSLNSFYATTKNDSMRKILDKLSFEKAGSDYENDNKEILSLYIFNKAK